MSTSAFVYFETNGVRWPERQISGVRSTVTQMLDDFTAHPVSEIVSGRSTSRGGNRRPREDALCRSAFGRPGARSRVLITLLRLEYQREILRRPNKERRSVLFADEFQSFYVSGEKQADSAFFERSRESNHANIVATQNLSSFSQENAKPARRHEFSRAVRGQDPLA